MEIIERAPPRNSDVTNIFHGLGRDDEETADERGALVDPFDAPGLQDDDAAPTVLRFNGRKIIDVREASSIDDAPQSAPLPRCGVPDARPWWQRGNFLSADDERELIARYQRHGDRAAADRIILAHGPLCAKIASKFPSLPFEEGLAAGAVGLMRALGGFNPDKGVRFSGYAKFWIAAQIRIAARAARSLVRRSRKEEKALQEKNVFLGDDLLSAPIGDDDDGDSLQDNVVSDFRSPIGVNDAASPEDEAHTTGLRARLMLVLGTMESPLSNRERRVFEARFMQSAPVLFKTLASELGISCERVRQISNAAQAKVESAISAARDGRPLTPSAIVASSFPRQKCGYWPEWKEAEWRKILSRPREGAPSLGQLAGISCHPTRPRTGLSPFQIRFRKQLEWQAALRLEAASI